MQKISSSTENFDLNKMVRNGKRLMAYEIIKRLLAINDSKTLLPLKPNEMRKGAKAQSI